MKSMAIHGIVSNLNINFYTYLRDMFQIKGDRGELLSSKNEAQQAHESPSFFDGVDELDAYVRSFRE